jgi:hypothetical protein
MSHFTKLTTLLVEMGVTHRIDKGPLGLAVSVQGRVVADSDIDDSESNLTKGMSCVFHFSKDGESVD